MGKRWSCGVQGRWSIKVVTTATDQFPVPPPHPVPALFPFPALRPWRIRDPKAAVLRKTVAERPKLLVNFLVNSDILLLRSCLSGCH